ncbi:hypothetical protein [Caldimonas brevitalea]|uniref:hypothetical protein n=1 Tax=Caldimonas brevitalea TaxID=413882 RepID=UPI0012FAB22F|nr:hypothetical protein [Caldimonas brevitalea]
MKLNLMEYLRQYLVDPEIVRFGELSTAESSKLPPEWCELLSVEGEDRVSTTLQCWMRFEEQFPEIIRKMSERLDSVQLLRHKGGYLLLYSIRSPSRLLYYASSNPRDRSLSPQLETLWRDLPSAVKEFYDFADGWYYLASRSLGLSPSKDIFILSDESWGILDEIEPPPVNLARTVALFTNGSFGYACVELSEDKDPNSSGLIWWSDKAPKLNLDFWGVVDAWTSIGMDS